MLGGPQEHGSSELRDEATWIIKQQEIHRWAVRSDDFRFQQQQLGSSFFLAVNKMHVRMH